MQRCYSVRGGGTAVYDTPRCKTHTHTLPILTIRPPGYFSTSYKLRTDTLALGIIIPNVPVTFGADGSFHFSAAARVHGSRLISYPCFTRFFLLRSISSSPLPSTQTLMFTFSLFYTGGNYQKLCVIPNSAHFCVRGD